MDKKEGCLNLGSECESLDFLLERKEERELQSLYDELLNKHL